MTYHFRNLIFEGGGVKGIAYLGALEALENKGITAAIDRIGGTSAGAINAVLLGLNYANDETRDILWGLDFNAFMDDSWGLVQDTQRLLQDYGWFKGDYFRDWIGRIIQAKTGNTQSTFADIEAMASGRGFKSLYFIGTNLSTGFSEVFSAEHTPRSCVADAVRISMSIPLFFSAPRSTRGDVYIDGGVLNNFPIKLFDRRKYIDTDHYQQTDYYNRVNTRFEGVARPISNYVYNKETLGFRLDTHQEIAQFRDHAEPPHRNIDSFFDYGWALIETMLEAQASKHLHSDDWARTVYIDSLGVGTTDFDLANDTKLALIEAGKNGVKRYFEWYDSAAMTLDK